MREEKLCDRFYRKIIPGEKNVLNQYIFAWNIAESTIKEVLSLTGLHCYGPTLVNGK